jgi:hypothetical protein
MRGATFRFLQSEIIVSISIVHMLSRRSETTVKMKWLRLDLSPFILANLQFQILNVS